MDSNGDLTVSVLDFGATIQSVLMKGKDGTFEVPNFFESTCRRSR